MYLKILGSNTPQHLLNPFCLQSFVSELYSCLNVHKAFCLFPIVAAGTTRSCIYAGGTKSVSVGATFVGSVLDTSSLEAHLLLKLLYRREKKSL